LQNTKVLVKQDFYYSSISLELYYAFIFFELFRVQSLRTDASSP